MPEPTRIERRAIFEQYRDDQPVGQWPSGVCKAPACLGGEPHIHVYNGDWIPVRAASETPEPTPQHREIDLGPCCGCEKVGPDVRTIVMLAKKGPIPGRGWGCLQCGLSSDGASAVLCDACLDSYTIRFACRGYPKDDGRIPVEELSGVHEHDRAGHPEEWDRPPLPPAFELRPDTDVLFADAAQPGDPECLCSRCLTEIPEDAVPVMAWSKRRPTHVYRFHPACLGMETFDDIDAGEGTP